MKQLFFITLLSIVAALYNTDSCYGQLVASYPFTSGEAIDVSGNNLHGIIVGCTPTCDRFNKPNSAMFFDGASYIMVPHNDKLSFRTQGFTLCAWIKFCKGLRDYAGIIAKGPQAIFYPGYQLTITEQGRITTQIGDSAEYGVERRGRTMLNDGKWHFVALVVGASNSKLAVDLYVDGKLESYTQKYTPLAGLNASLHYTNPLFIGKERNSAVYFNGIIDDVEMYSQPLVQQQIDSLYYRNNWPIGNSQPLIDGKDTVVVCNNQTVSLTTSANCYSEYQWSTGARKRTIVVNNPGKYILQATDNSGCLIQDTVVVVECETASELIAYYPFNSNAQDSTINQLHGIAKGVISTCDRFGKVNSAYAFDGRSSIEIPHHSKLSFGTSSFSICAWVKFCQPLNDYSGIVCKGPVDVFYPGYQVTIASSNRLTTQIGDSSGYGVEYRGNTNLDDGKWHFLTLVVTPMDKNRQWIKMYVDKNREAITQIYTPRAGLNSSLNYTTSLFIGRDRNSVRFFKGIIDDVRIYKGAIPDSLIMNLYDEGNWQGGETDLMITQEGSTELCPGDSVVVNGIGCFFQWLWSTGDTTSELIIRKPGTYTLTAGDGSGCQVSRTIIATDKKGGEMKTNLSRVYKVYPGISKDLTLSMESDVSNFKVSAFELDLQYNAGVAYLEKISLDNTILDGWSITTTSQSPGRYKAILQAPNNQFIKGSGVLAILTFETHLGDTVASQIPYSITPIISSCKVYSQSEPGFISIDSTLCGIKYRLIESVQQKIVLSNPIFDKKNHKLSFRIDNPQDQLVAVHLYNFQGEEESAILNRFLLKGQYDMSYITASTPSGLYFLVISSPYYKASTLIMNK